MIGRTLGGTERRTAFALSLLGGGTTSLEFAVGDLATERVDAIVNPMTGIVPGGGMVDLAIQRMAGVQLRRAFRAAATPRQSEPVITPGFDLHARFVIHVVPPRYADDPHDALRKLGSCYREAVALAQGRGLSTLAFPSIATGALGFPVDKAAPVALEAIVSQLKQGGTPLRVRFVLFGPATYDAYVSAARRLLGP
jgi:O-acetyl-ADP-ribose deacetylase